VDNIYIMHGVVTASSSVRRVFGIMQAAERVTKPSVGYVWPLTTHDLIPVHQVAKTVNSGQHPTKAAINGVRPKSLREFPGAAVKSRWAETPREPSNILRSRALLGSKLLS
jgi:hypothetical protein